MTKIYIYRYIYVKKKFNTVENVYFSYQNNHNITIIGIPSIIFPDLTRIKIML